MRLVILCKVWLISMVALGRGLITKILYKVWLLEMVTLRKISLMNILVFVTTGTVVKSLIDENGIKKYFDNEKGFKNLD